MTALRLSNPPAGFGWFYDLIWKLRIGRRTYLLVYQWRLKEISHDWD